MRPHPTPVEEVVFDVELVAKLRAGAIEGRTHFEAASALAALAHDELSAYGSAGGEKLTDEQMVATLVRRQRRRLSTQPSSHPAGLRDGRCHTGGLGDRDRLPSYLRELRVSRINDVGGMAGFPPIVEEPDEPRFHADWEAHVFALNGALIRRGVYNLDEFRDAIERMPAQDYLAASYYERWFAAITTLLVEKGVASPDELAVPDDHAH